MTTDEELTLLEDNIRKLKVEYDVYFAGGTKKPPEDIEWRVRTAIKKYSEGRHLTFQQHFRYNTMAQKYAVFSDLWRRKLKIKEEGYDIFLVLEATIGFNRQEEEGRAAPAETVSLRRKSSEPDLSMTAHDVRFLKSLRISVDDAA